MTTFFIFILSMVSTSGVETVRKVYFTAIDNERKTNELILLCETSKDPVISAYKGVGNTLKAKFHYNPLKKIAYFEKGVDMIEKAIIKAPSNIEIRFLRLTVQEGSPSFLKYKSNIKEDRNMISNQLHKTSIPKWYKNKIHEYLNKK